jgi:hypothetical protein
MELRKTLTDAGYIAVGLGVMGYQQGRTRAEALRERVAGGTACASQQLQDARAQLEETARTAIDRATELGTEVGKRVEPFVDQARGTLTELPDQVVRAVEPVTQRVRGLVAPAA